MSFFPVLLFVYTVLCQTPPGTTLAIDQVANLAILNAERTFWNLGLLQWDDDLGTLSQKAANLCDFNTISLQTTSQNFATQQGYTFDIQNADHRVGEVHALVLQGTPGGISTLYTLVFKNGSSGSAFFRDDYDCKNDKCYYNDVSNCAVYKQAVWRYSTRVACSASTCPQGPPGFPAGKVQYMVCNYITSGNWNNNPTFGDAQQAVCAHNFTEPPPSPQPSDCSLVNCTAGCGNPDVNALATCDDVSGKWVFPAGDVNVSNLYSVDCPTTVSGNLIGSGKLFVGLCGSLAVSGTSNIGSVTVVLDMKGKSGIVDNTYWTSTGPVLTYASGNAPSAANTYNVFSPYSPMCSQIVSIPTGAYVRFFTCPADPSNPGPLPNGTLPNGASTSTASGGPGTQASAGNPPASDTKSAPPPSGGGGGGLPWWAIILIVIACIIVLGIIIGLIVYLVLQMKKKEERY